MSKLTITQLTLLVALLLSGCSIQATKPEELPFCTTPPLIPLYVFEVEYINHAWGYQHSGIVIDSAGNLYTYSWDTPDWVPSQQEQYDDASLARKYNPNRRFIRKISSDMLASMLALRASAVNSSYSDTVNVGADAGGLQSSIYQYNEGAVLRYQRIALRLTGDFTFEKQSDAARVIADWLESLHTR